MRSRLAGWLGVILVMASSGAIAIPSIGVFADPSGASCNIEQTIPGTGTFYILCLLGGPVADGIQQAEFRVDGFPAEWFANPIPNPIAYQTIGSLLEGGATLLFPGCRPGADGIVLLYTIPYIAAGPEVVNRYLNVFKTTIRMNPLFQCPLLTLCAGPPLVKVCATGMSGIINGPPCSVGLHASSWSLVKSLYE